MARGNREDLSEGLLGGDGQAVSIEDLHRQATQVLSGIAVVTVLTTGALTLLVPELLASGLLAYTIGLRHAIDADHIAAIDNITKRLTTLNKRSAMAGFFFALGHSTVVLIMCGFVAVGREKAMDHLTHPDRQESMTKTGTVLGGLFSACFLLGVGVLNTCTMRELLQAWKEQARYGEHEHAVAGLCMTCCPSLFMGITSSWQMYPVGFLFGLSFDTSSEIALLAMVGLSGDLPHPAYVMILPFMFLTGMCLIDTLNGLFMAWLYGKSSSTMQRLYFNIVLTGATAAIALFIGALELLSVVATAEDLHGGLWAYVQLLNDDFEVLGLCIVIFFMSCAALAIGCYRRLFPEDRSGAVREDLMKYIERGEFIDRSGI